MSSYREEQKVKERSKSKTKGDRSKYPKGVGDKADVKNYSGVTVTGTAEEARQELFAISTTNARQR